MTTMFMPNLHLIESVSFKKKKPYQKEICLICNEEIKEREKRIYLKDGRVYHYDCFVSELFKWAQGRKNVPRIKVDSG